MSDMLGSGISALLGFQVALDTTSHNIANVNTQGYSRQSVAFGTRLPQRYGNYFIGSGTQVNSVARLYDRFLTDQVRVATSAQSRLGTFSDLGGRIDNLLADPKAGMQPALDSFFGAVHDLANNPSDTPTRQALLGQANALTDRFHYLSTQLSSLDHETNQRIATGVNEINGLGSAIAQLNDQITQAKSTGAAPNDLLDKRDELVRQLSAKIGVTVTQQDDSTVNVFVGNGQALVLGQSASALRVVQNAYDPTRTDIATATGGVVTNQLTGGEVGGMLDFRREMLDPARNQLGRAAFAMASAFNAQHRDGVDLRGALGGDFFSIGSPSALANANNTGSATVGASITNVGQLTSADYTMRYNGASWQLSRSDGTVVPMTGTGTAADPFVADGLSFTVAGGANAGDSFLIRPTRDMAASIGVAITDPSRIAAASPVRGTVAGTNTGDGAFGAFTITDPTNPALQSGVTITFTSPTTYQVNGAGSFAYTPGSPIAMNGWSTSISGAPRVGDTFTVGANTSGVGDNANARALASVADLGLLDGGTSTIGNAYGQLVASVGSTSQQAKTNLDAQTTLLEQSTAQQQGVSGVNLDEEAANLVKFQQSYQAAAQVITAANTIFDSLIQAVRGG